MVTAHPSTDPYLIKRAQAELVELHFKPRPNFMQYHFLSAPLFVHVMTEKNDIILIGKRHHPLRLSLHQKTKNTTVGKSVKRRLSESVRTITDRATLAGTVALQMR